MRRLIAALAVGLVLTAPMTGFAQAPRGAAPTATTGASEDWLYPLVLGGGAVAGVLLYNVATTGLIFVAPGTGSRVSFSDVAMSRVYAVSAAVVGGWIANWLYSGQEYRSRPVAP